MRGSDRSIEGYDDGYYTANCWVKDNRWAKAWKEAAKFWREQALFNQEAMYEWRDRAWSAADICKRLGH